jgi:iron complex transport system substrate-binding protein
VLQLVDKERVVSASYLAKRGVRDIDPRLAEGVATNFGSSEEILAQRPDLILAGDFSTAMTRDVARRAGSPMVQVKTATSFQDIRDITRQVGAAVGEAGKAEALVAQMDADLENLAARPAHEPWRVVVWNGDSAPGGQTLAGAILRAAGARGLEAREDSAVYASLGLEELLMAEPDFVLFIDDGGREPSLLSAAMQHRALKRRFGDRLIPYSEALFDCGVPQSAGAARALRDAFEARRP